MTRHWLRNFYRKTYRPSLLSKNLLSTESVGYPIEGKVTIAVPIANKRAVGVPRRRFLASKPW